MCVNVTKVISDQCTYKNTSTDVPKCLAANKGSYCSYYYSSTDSFKTRYCCSADGSIGYCPLPIRQAMSTFISLDAFVLGNSTNCRKEDRSNFMANLECGIGDGSPLQSYVNSRIMKENWSFAQSAKTLNCLQNYLPESYSNLLKSYGLALFYKSISLVTLIIALN